MSQKNETTVLVLALLITLGVASGIFWFFRDNIIPQNKTINNPESIKQRISFGEKTLTTVDTSPAKKAGIEALAGGDYNKAIAILEAALRLKRNDPEALIFLNNARIASAKSYTIVTSLPVVTDPSAYEEILRGIAQAQNEINASGGIKGVPLKIGKELLTMMTSQQYPSKSPQP